MCLKKCSSLLTARKIGDSPIKSDIQLGIHTHLGAESQSEGTIRLVPKSWKMVIIIPRRRGGTWEGVHVAIWCIEWICRMRGGLVHHTIVFLLRYLSRCCEVLAVGRAPTIFQNDWFFDRISNCFQSPMFSIASLVQSKSWHVWTHGTKT